MAIQSFIILEIPLNLDFILKIYYSSDNPVQLLEHTEEDLNKLIIYKQNLLKCRFLQKAKLKFKQQEIYIPKDIMTRDI